MQRRQILSLAVAGLAALPLPALAQQDNVGSVSQAKEIEEAAPRLGMRITPVGLRQPADIEPAFKRGTALGDVLERLMDRASPGTCPLVESAHVRRRSRRLFIAGVCAACGCRRHAGR